MNIGDVYPEKSKQMNVPDLYTVVNRLFKSQLLSMLYRVTSSPTAPFRNDDFRLMSVNVTSCSF